MAGRAVRAPGGSDSRFFTTTKKGEQRRTTSLTGVGCSAYGRCTYTALAYALQLLGEHAVQTVYNTSTNSTVKPVHFPLAPRDSMHQVSCSVLCPASSEQISTKPQRAVKLCLYYVQRLGAARVRMSRHGKVQTLTVAGLSQCNAYVLRDACTA